MALRKLTQAAVLVGRKSFIARQVHATASMNFFNFKKPCPSSEGGLAVGFEKILMDAAKVGEDPLEDMNRDQKTPPTGGSGTKEDPYRMFSTAPSRYIEIEGITANLHCFFFVIIIKLCSKSEVTRKPFCFKSILTLLLPGTINVP
uniref:Uncharacterized protein n=1 Tax=Ciona intestinalis TaxID=7719 RepID=F6R9D1_CIOIN